MRRLVSGFILCLMVMCIAPVTYGADWVKIFTSFEGADYFEDISSVEKDGSYIKVRIKIVFPPPDETEQFVTLQEFNCKESKQRTLQLITYYRDGGSELDSEESDWNYFAPETAAEAIFESVCK